MQIRKPERKIRVVGYVRPKTHSLLHRSAARQRLSLSEEMERILSNHLKELK
jgi:hypothetical protein